MGRIRSDLFVMQFSYLLQRTEPADTTGTATIQTLILQRQTAVSGVSSES